MDQLPHYGRARPRNRSARLFTLFIVLVLILGGIWFLQVITRPQQRLEDEIPNLPEQGQVPTEAQIQNKQDKP